MDLAVEACRASWKLPQHERFDLARQIRRAAVSVPSNIAEGYGRRTRGDYLRFLNIANGSLKELETQLILAARISLISDAEAEPALSLCGKAGRMFTRLFRSMPR